MSTATIDARLQSQIDKAFRWPTIAAPIPVEMLPRHVAIIMDGNGRWATGRGMIRVNGHEAGVDAVRSSTRYCGQLHLDALTLYAFSTENWKRPQAEIRYLFRLLKKYLVDERAELIANNVRLTAIGNIAALSPEVQDELRRTQELTARNSGLNLCLALSYGAQDELVEAARRIAERAAKGELDPNAIQSSDIAEALFTAGMPPVELLIRSAGENRLSNFLLWQSCGAEYVSTPTCWPDFRETHLKEAILEYARRRTPQLQNSEFRIQ